MDFIENPEEVEQSNKVYQEWVSRVIQDYNDKILEEKRIKKELKKKERERSKAMAVIFPHSVTRNGKTVVWKG